MAYWYTGSAFFQIPQSYLNEYIHNVCGNSSFNWFLNAIRDCYWIKWGGSEFHNLIGPGKKLLYWLVLANQ